MIYPKSNFHYLSYHPFYIPLFIFKYNKSFNISIKQCCASKTNDIWKSIPAIVYSSSDKDARMHYQRTSLINLRTEIILRCFLFQMKWEYDGLFLESSLNKSEENMFVYRTYVQVVYLTFDILAFKPDTLSSQRWLINKSIGEPDNFIPGVWL